MDVGDFPLSAQAISRGLNTRLFRHIRYYEQLGSTNNIAGRLAENGEPEGTVIITDEQTTGRGRLGRMWLAPARSSILMSAILRPPVSLASLTRVTMAASLAARAAIHLETGLETLIKWPNDILVNGKKCGGVLAEANTTGNELEYVILGMGINVNFAAASVPGIPTTATTLADELGHPAERIALVRALLSSLDQYYGRLKEGESLHDEWAAALSNLHQVVLVQTPWGHEHGVAEAVDEDGALILRRADGSPVRLIAGEVTLSPR